MSLTMSSFFAGRAVLYDDGHFVGTLSKNIFGGVDYHDIHGTLEGHTAQFGHQTNMYEQNGHLSGYYRPNIHGGHDFHGENGALTYHSASNIQGGHDMFDAHNTLVSHSIPNINGGLDWHSVQNLADNHDLSHHIDTITDLFHHHIGS
ncbi:hypothetical protein ABR157_005361 [Enterobacter soli]|uniref:hypothetical protein n=1 Tax=Enterobacter cloacae complex TaxID=354276 RepID=UPI0011130085|nr:MULTISPECIES: hypothetical protein [Enterobacter cloacae complex]EKY1501760.1 hypothetical protein [Enterobacter cloacae]MBJ4955418.1 hypothetical protein [Salmonella enterica subsp. enterica serovar Goldcoast]HDR2728350.1 hypothetical protein [Enterobacter roggenkampii]HDT2135823.1 hypothetical protein [Enterobacter roggenkampii]